MEEAELIETDGGLEPEEAGWFVVSVGETTSWRSDEDAGLPWQ